MGAESPAIESIAAALFGAVRQGVLALLYGHPNQRFFQRQIVRELGLGSGAVQRELVRLTRSGILTRNVEGRQTYFQANGDSPIFDELRSLIRKTFGLSGVLQAALLPIAGRVRLAFIYGSIARGAEKASSDVDVMIVGDDVSLDDIMPGLSTAQRQLRREVNPSVYRTAEFCRKLAEGHHFVTSVVAGPKTFLVGDERELARLAQVRMGGAAPPESSRDRRPARRRRSRSAGVSDSRSRR
jgi:hypothetical protein